MNREDIIRMAEEAGAIHYWHLSNLERFAELVASTKLEEVAQEFDKMPFGDTSASFAIFVREMKR